MQIVANDCRQALLEQCSGRSNGVKSNSNNRAPPAIPQLTDWSRNSLRGCRISSASQACSDSGFCMKYWACCFMYVFRNPSSPCPVSGRSLIISTVFRIMNHRPCEESVFMKNAEAMANRASMITAVERILGVCGKCKKRIYDKRHR